jgi:hypothetical protein
LNYKFAQYTLNATASASVTIAMCSLPAGARINNVHLITDNDDLDTTGAGSVSVATWTNGNHNVNYVLTAAASVIRYAFTPEYAALGYRHTASSHVVLKLSNFAATGTGTATTIFSLQVAYDCQLEGD